jgi:hypothetical protein
MLYLVFAYCILSLVCLLAGIIFYELMGSFKPPHDGSQKPVVLYLITGLILITAPGQWITLFLPLNLLVFSVVLLLLIGLSVLLRKKIQIQLQSIIKNIKKLSAISLAAIGIFLLMILTLNAGPTIMDDTDSYHIQNIKWLQEYGTVPGLANLHLRYGFNSAWAVGIGLLSPNLKGINNYLVLNGLLSWWLCLYFIEKINPVFIRRDQYVSINQYLGLLALLILCLIAWPMIRGNAVNSNYDFITACCIIILFTESFYSSKFSNTIEWMLWPCYLFTVRIINYPLLLLMIPPFLQMVKGKKWRAILTYTLLAVVLITPFIARNVILSGYPFFPVYQVDLFSVDWKASKQMTQNIVEFVKYHNRISTQFASISDTKSLAFPRWVLPWYEYLPSYNKLLVSLSLLSYLICLFKWKKVRQRTHKYALWIIIIMMLQLFSWFCIAPDPRFGYGSLLGGIALLPVVLPLIQSTSIIKIAFTIAFLITTIACLVYTVRKTSLLTTYQNPVLPYPLPIPPTKVIMLNGLELKIPQKILNNWNARCYGTELPCLYQVHPGLRARGKRIQDGFYLENDRNSINDPYMWY